MVLDLSTHHLFMLTSAWCSSVRMNMIPVAVLLLALSSGAGTAAGMKWDPYAIVQILSRINHLIIYRQEGAAAQKNLCHRSLSVKSHSKDGSQTLEFCLLSSTSVNCMEHKES